MSQNEYFDAFFDKRVDESDDDVIRYGVDYDCVLTKETINVQHHSCAMERQCENSWLCCAKNLSCEIRNFRLEFGNSYIHTSRKTTPGAFSKSWKTKKALRLVWGLLLGAKF